MKFKVGDKVRVIDCDIDGKKCSHYNEIGEIKIIKNAFRFPYLVYFQNNGKEYFKDEELELVKDNIDKNLKLEEGDIVIYKNKDTGIIGKRYILPRENFLIREYEDVFNKTILTVVKPIEFETIYEVKEEILDKEEKEYLSVVIKPFKNIIKYITKVEDYMSDKYYISIHLTDDTMSFPNLANKNMYKNMEIDKQYTLKELEL